MVLSFREAANGFNHRRLWFERKLWRRPENYFFTRLDPGPLSCQVVVGDNGKPMVCHICGYALACVRAGNGWSLQGCTATSVRRLLKLRRFMDWIDSLDCKQPRLADGVPLKQESAQLPGASP